MKHDPATKKSGFQSVKIRIASLVFLNYDQTLYQRPCKNTICQEYKYLLIKISSQYKKTFTQGCIEARLIEIGPMVPEKILKKINNVFRFIASPLFWRRAWAFLSTNLISSYPGMFCAKIT